MACWFTGLRADDSCSVVPHHAGHDKHRDDHAYPIRQNMHKLLHDMGEASFIRKHAPDRLLVDMSRAYAEKMYRERT